MVYLAIKYLCTAAVIVFVSELAKRSDRLGALVASLPLVTLLTLFWLYFEHQSAQKISNHAWYTFWYVIPTLPMFLVFPWSMDRWGFWPAMGISVLLTMACFGLFALIMRRFGVMLI